MQEQIIEVETLKVKNQKLVEDLTRSQNQERATKEKVEHLEIEIRKLRYLTGRQPDNASETERGTILGADLGDQQSLKFSNHGDQISNIREEIEKQYQQDTRGKQEQVNQLKKENTLLLNKMKEIEKTFESSTEDAKDQRQQMFDLEKKNRAYLQEIDLINQESQKQINTLTIANQKLAYQQENKLLNQQLAE